MYKHFLRHILFMFSPEAASNYLLSILGLFSKIPGGRSLLRFFYSRPVKKCSKKDPRLQTELFGMTFPTPLGIAGGLDKNGEHYNELGALGYSFVEIGSLTIGKQEGNPRPRVFRITKDKALINRLGINNNGVKYAIDQIRKDNPKVILSANIACMPKRNTMKEVSEDYKKAFELMYDFVDMFTVNISFPKMFDYSNDMNLDDMEILAAVMDPILDLRLCYEETKPILLKISPDMSFDLLDKTLDWCMASGVDGIVACNTTLSRDGLTIEKEEIDRIGKGGMSGAPLFNRSLEVIKHINEHTKGRLPVIGVGGIMSSEQARQMLDSGASLIEVHTGFIYEGLSFAKRLIRGLAKADLNK